MRSTRLSVSLALLLGAGFAPAASAQCATDALDSGEAEAGDIFGRAFGVSGDTLFVGARGDHEAALSAGAVFVFERGPAGWAPDVKLLASDGELGDAFGVDVALDATTAFVGAPFETSAGAGSGAAYVFERQGTVWNETQKLLPTVGTNGRYGSSIFVQGDTAMVSAPLLVNARGRVFVYERQGTSWVEVQVLEASDTATGDFFSADIAISGDTAIIGASGAGPSGRGRVYFFERSGTQWVEDQSIDGPSPGAAFGRSVALDGDRALVGKHARAVVIERAGGVWGIVTQFEPSDGSPAFQNFATDVALVGDLAMVGAPHSVFEGATFVFERFGTAWEQTARFQPAGLVDENHFGRKVGLQGREVFVGAPFDGSNSPPGSAYVFAIPDATRPYCFCVADAPCGNEDSLAGCENGSGQGALLRGCGTNSVGADDLELTISSIDANKSGLIYMGPNTIQVPFGDGQRCVGGTTKRFPLRNSGPSGVIAEGPGVVGFTQANFPGAFQIAAGRTWSFQGWFRDPMGPCGGGFNLSNAVEVTFAP